jgi:phage FluMu protein Com
MNARWWDPESEDYNPEVFFHSVFENYHCPFPECEEMPAFDHPHDIAGHLLDVHAKTKFRCPGCLKLFKRASGMVSHMESTQKCPVRKSKNFKSTLDEITGGFIKAKRLPQPTIYRSDTAVVKSGQVIDGVMSTMYKASWPNKK